MSYRKFIRDLITVISSPNASCLPDSKEVVGCRISIWNGISKITSVYVTIKSGFMNGVFAGIARYSLFLAPCPTTSVFMCEFILKVTGIYYQLYLQLLDSCLHAKTNNPAFFVYFFLFSREGEGVISTVSTIQYVHFPMMRIRCNMKNLDFGVI